MTFDLTSLVWSNAQVSTPSAKSSSTITIDCTGQPPLPQPTTVPDTDALKVSLERDGKLVHRTTGASVKSGQAGNLMTLINQIIDQGHVIHRGDIIICGDLGGARPAATGRYTAAYGPLGTITFELR